MWYPFGIIVFPHQSQDIEHAMRVRIDRILGTFCRRVCSFSFTQCQMFRHLIPAFAVCITAYTVKGRA